MVYMYMVLLNIYKRRTPTSNTLLILYTGFVSVRVYMLHYKSKKIDIGRWTLALSCPSSAISFLSHL